MLRSIVALLSFCLLATTAHAQYGGRTVTLVVGFPAGGSNDLAARIIAPRLSERLGTPVVVVNKAGANATIGADFVAKAPPDGHTLLVASASPLVIVPHTASSIPYDTLKDFAPVTTLGITPGAIGMNNAVPARDLKQLMASADGRDLRIASTGAGGMPHLTIELLKLGARPGGVVHVPYKGAALAVTDVMGGHVDGIVADLASLIGMFRDGRLRPLVVTGRERASFLPDVPTALEQGYSQLVAENWLGVLAPARTPAATVDRLHEALRTIMQEPPVREQMLKVGYAVTPSPAPAEFQQFLRGEFEKWGKVARDSGARAD